MSAPSPGWSPARPGWECTHKKANGDFDCYANGTATWENENANGEGACDVHAEEMGVFLPDEPAEQKESTTP